MAEPVIFDEGGMWVLVKENADSCRLETATADTPTEEPGRGGLLAFAVTADTPTEEPGRGGLLAFVVAAGAVALHLLGGA